MASRLPAPRVRPARIRVGLLLLIAGLLLSLPAGLAAAQEPDGPLIDVVEVAGPLDRPVVGHLLDALEQAHEDGSELLVITLDTPGALGEHYLDLVDRITTGDVPVVVWVGPPGARATGAGAVLAQSAHVLATAPGTSLGGAQPANLRGGLEDDTVPTRLEELALARERSGDAARQMGGTVYATLPGGGPGELAPDASLPRGVERDAIVALPESEMVAQGIVDVTGVRLDDVLREVDGTQVAVAGGSQVLDVDPVTARVRFDNLGVWRRILHTVADPTLAYLLVIAGALAVVFELYQPGFGVAGISGLVLLGFGLYGLAVLPVSWLAFAVLAVGLALLSADLAVGGLGALTISGTVATALGSWFLFDGPAPLRVSGWVIGLVVASALLFFVVVMTVVLRAQGNQAMVGAEQVVGKVGVVRSTLNPGGHIFVDGALWRARAPEEAGKVRTGVRVRVLGLNDDQSLDVELVDEDAPQAAQH
jgi:membrane-bound serine protease (ClpP class)